MDTAVSRDALLRLLHWVSPAYPTGGYAYSHGLEWAIAAGLVGDAESLQRWVADLFRFSVFPFDGVVFREVHRAGRRKAMEDVVRWDRLLSAARSPRELREESVSMGRAFLKATAAVHGGALVSALWDRVAAERTPGNHLVAFALACADFGIPVETGMAAFFHSFASEVVSAGIRLVPLGQTEGQRILAELIPGLLEGVQRSLRMSPEEIWSTVPMVEWASASHERQYSRLFRS